MKDKGRKVGSDHERTQQNAREDFPSNWSVFHPQQEGQPEFIVTLRGECWHDVERALQAAREAQDFTAPHDVAEAAMKSAGLIRSTMSERLDELTLHGSILALIQSLTVMREESRKAGKQGWSVIAARASGTVKTLALHVTRLLSHPDSRFDHGSVEGALTAQGCEVNDDGRVFVNLTSELGGAYRFPLEELTPAGAISEANRTIVTVMAKALVEDTIAKLVEAGALERLTPELLGQAAAGMAERTAPEYVTVTTATTSADIGAYLSVTASATLDAMVLDAYATSIPVVGRVTHSGSIEALPADQVHHLEVHPEYILDGESGRTWITHNRSDVLPCDPMARVDVVGTDDQETLGWFAYNILWRNVAKWRVSAETFGDPDETRPTK